MKPELTQRELEKLYKDGKVCVWQYKTRYQIDYSSAQKMFIIWKAGRFDGNIGITKRGRFVAVTPEEGRLMELKAYHI